MGKIIGFIILMSIALFLIAGTASADSLVVSFEPATLALSQGSSGQATISLSEAPGGLAGYDIVVSLANPGVAEIISVTYPSWAQLTQTPAFPSQSVLLRAGDTDKRVNTGATDIPLATISLKGVAAGTTPVVISIQKMDADDGALLTPGTRTLEVTVAGTGPSPSPTSDSSSSSSDEGPTAVTSVATTATTSPGTTSPSQEATTAPDTQPTSGQTTQHTTQPGQPDPTVTSAAATTVSTPVPTVSAGIAPAIAAIGFTGLCLVWFRGRRDS